MKIKVDYTKDAGKMGRHNLSFRTGIHERKRKNAKRDRRAWNQGKRDYVH